MVMVRGWMLRCLDGGHARACWTGCWLFSTYYSVCGLLVQQTSFGLQARRLGLCCRWRLYRGGRRVMVWSNGFNGTSALLFRFSALFFVFVLLFLSLFWFFFSFFPWGSESFMVVVRHRHWNASRIKNHLTRFTCWILFPRP
ncbi:hypothetical protein CPC08DRAFT_51860 [Agrocybe pediades]|nr:hypothetical protein CPC08DRAFT_51860 [Agrocybe pediades]